MRYLPYLLSGIVFGFLLVKAEAVSWYRLQEMFHLQSFHMYGLILSAVITGHIGSRIVLQRAGRPSVEGTPIAKPVKPPGRFRYPLGGLIFGFGWGLIGLCPGPIFAMVGSGSLGALLVLGGALHGTWLYGALQHRLPH